MQYQSYNLRNRKFSKLQGKFFLEFEILDSHNLLMDDEPYLSKPSAN